MPRNPLFVRSHGWISILRVRCPDCAPGIGRREIRVTAGLPRTLIAAPALALLLALVPAISSAQWTQMGPDIDGEAAGDLSGNSVALSSDGARLAVGARSNDNLSGVGAGQVRVFDWDAALEGWVQLGLDIDGEAAQDHSGYSVALSSSGPRVAVGAPGNDDGGTSAGHVRVFEWVGSSWVQLGSDLDGDAAYDNFGGCVDLSSDGSRLAVGALGNDGNGFDSGLVRIFEWDGGSSSWVQLGQDIRGEADFDWSGASVALSADGSRVAVGAPENDGNGSNSGHVRVFEWVVGSSSWIQLGSDIDGEAVDDHFGTFVSLSSSGARLAAGAPGNDNAGGDDAGRTRVFRWDGGSWVQLGPDIDGEGAGDLSGSSLDLSSDGSRIAVGAFYNDNANGVDAGHVRVFTEAIFSDGFETGNTNRWSWSSPTAG